MLKKGLFSGQRRPFAFGATALACVLILFSFSPVRQVAADFLDIFRVRKFAVIPVDPAHLSELDDLLDLAEAGVFGEPELVRKPVDPQEVVDTAEASAVAGFPVLEPADLPEDAVRTKLVVEFGPAMHYEIDRAMMEQLLVVAQVTDVTLPDVDKISVDVDIPPAVVATYVLDVGIVTIRQLPSPEVKMPAGIDPAVFGEIGLQVLGLPPAEAAQMARQIDWASTLVIPLPTNVATFRPVTVNGVEGLLVDERAEANADRIVLWQKDGYIYSVNGHRVRGKQLLQIANSLQ